MVDSTNPRIMADNIKELNAGTQANAKVIEALGTYSLTEVDTGKKWIDGSVIYRKIFIVDDPTIGELANVAHGISNLGIVIDCHGVAQAATGISGKNMPYSSTLLLTFNATNIEYNIGVSQSAVKKLILFFEYTKVAAPTPDVLHSPDPDTRTLEEPETEPEPEPEPEPIEKKK